MNKDKTIIYSPYKLDQNEIDLLISKFSFIDGKNMANVVDSKIIAGVIVRHGNQIIDLSIKTKLNNLKSRLYEINK